MATFKQVNKQTKASPFDAQQSDKLHQIIVEVRKVYRQWSAAKWTDTFRLLRQELDNGEERISRTLEWFASHARDKRCPSISNANDFRKRFDWLEDLAERDCGPSIVITEEAAFVAKIVLKRKWPQATQEQVIPAVQLSLTRLHEFRRRRLLLLASLKTKDTFFHFITHLGTKLGDPRHFTEHWMLAIHTRVANWKAWNGNLLAEAFSETHKDFQKMGKGWASSFAGDARLWTRFIEELSKCR